MIHPLIMIGVISTLIIGFLFHAQALSQNVPVLHPKDSHDPHEKVLSTHSISLTNRQPNKWVNDVFKDNILLNIAYLRGTANSTKTVDWDSVNQPFTYEMVLKPGEVFAFHDNVLPEFKATGIRTTNAHWNTKEGFRSDGNLIGDGVCHLASLMYWAAKDANLESVAPANHNFAAIPQIPKQYGVAILYLTGQYNVNQKQNLYVKNDKNKPVAFVFSYQNEELQVAVKELL